MTMPTQAEEQLQLSPADFARRSGMTLNHTYSLLWSGRLQGSKIDGQWRIPASALEGAQRTTPFVLTVPKTEDEAVWQRQEYKRIRTLAKITELEANVAELRTQLAAVLARFDGFEDQMRDLRKAAAKQGAEILEENEVSASAQEEEL